MNPIKAFLTGVQLKANGLEHLPFPLYGSGNMWTFRPQSKVNLAKAGDGLGNSAAFAVTTALGTAFSEPTVREFERVGNQWEPVERSPAAELLADPNPFIETELLWMYEVAAIASTGSAFYHKVRDQLGQIRELWPLYPAFMTPVTPDDGTEFITAWKYRIPGGQEVVIPTSDVVHRRWQIDRNDFRKGWAPLREVLIEVLQDSEASTFSTSLLTNMGVPGVVLSPADPDDPGPSDPAAMAREFQSKFSGANRGQPFVSSGSLKVDMVSFNPEQMDLTALRRVPEERITAALGWPAILSGLGAGLTATSGRGESSTLRESATEQRLVPMWELAGKQWTRQLLYDESYGAKNPLRQLKFDLADVRALQKDQDLLVKRLDTAIRGGWALVSEGRRAINLPVGPNDDVYLRSVSSIAVGVDEDPLVDSLDGEPQRNA